MGRVSPTVYQTSAFLFLARDSGFMPFSVLCPARQHTSKGNSHTSWREAATASALSQIPLVPCAGHEGLPCCRLCRRSLPWAFLPCTPHRAISALPFSPCGVFKFEVSLMQFQLLFLSFPYRATSFLLARPSPPEFSHPPAMEI